MHRRTILIGGGIAAVAAAAAGVAAYRASRTRERDAAALLALVLPDLSGREQPLAQWRGKILVVNFWATWCGPCREEMPHFVRAQAEHAATGLQFVGIAVDQVDKVRQFTDELGVNYPILIGGYGAIELSRALGNSVGALPFTIVLDRQGAVVWTHLGAVKEPQFNTLLAGLLTPA
ncbi:MAG: TlpA family protein disulfide reductase [Proteobacteria bacterium]|jgi:thiol-disulfide isomerase/thioredoxin|nr:TlpA family protein disulfide reductase [Pseudomonadota bacterium]